MPWIKSSKWEEKQSMSVACLQQTQVFTHFSAESHTQLHFLPPPQRERLQKRCCRGNDRQRQTSDVSWCESATPRGRGVALWLLTQGNKGTNAISGETPPRWRKRGSWQKQREKEDGWTAVGLVWGSPAGVRSQNLYCQISGNRPSTGQHDIGVFRCVFFMICLCWMRYFWWCWMIFILLQQLHPAVHSFICPKYLIYSNLISSHLLSFYVIHLCQDYIIKIPCNYFRHVGEIFTLYSCKATI